MERGKIAYYGLDADHRVIETDQVTWSNQFEPTNDRHVGYTQITSEITVSTVFLGIDHRFTGKGPPLLFETLVFGSEMDGEMWRYTSWDDAEVGHAMAVKKVRAVIGQKVGG